MIGIILTWIFLWSSVFLLCCVSAVAGAAERIRKDEKYSFKKLNEKREAQAA